MDHELKTSLRTYFVFLLNFSRDKASYLMVISMGPPQPSPGERFRRVSLICVLACLPLRAHHLAGRAPQRIGI